MRLVLASGVSLAVGGCENVDTGVVELAWVFVDRNGDPIYPAGQFSLGNRDACDLPARYEDATTNVDLHVELTICDPECNAGCRDESCQIIPSARFPCDVPRSSLPEVPAATTPYLFEVGVVIVRDDVQIPCARPAQTCIAVPGPRERTVWRGLVTDLQVYQFVVDIDQDQPQDGGGALDLEECGCA